MINLENSLFLNEMSNIINAENGRDKHTVLIVDDEINNLMLLKRTLRGQYNILTAQNGAEGLQVLQENMDEISVIVSDHKMPVMEGTDFLAHANSIAPDVIKVLLTGFSDIEILTDAVNKCNLFQYVMKPYEPEEITRVIENGVSKFDFTSSKAAILKDLRELFYKTIKSMASVLDAKDPYTHGHSLRVTLYSLIVSRELGLDDKALEEIETAGLLHDIGKIAVPKAILCKPGKLTDEEFEIMKSHPDNSEKFITSVKKLSGISNWLRAHHERWDGRGYPDGLQGEEIPISSRIIAIADTYDAMTSTRPYRTALTHEVAIDEIQKCAGGQFDPELAALFVQMQDVIKSAKDDPEEYYSKYSYLHEEINSQIYS